ncbi:HNH endonuclease family protein [Psychromicrobium lacuslunae]|uniref:HNH endonuclease family protein n=1 Tax=Psychromicrobium lacuslunae TaxID=1618207 RepID=UPI001F35038D|nr:HNH endonuclease family protein [Psychromicrobium lacuslunae]
MNRNSPQWRCKRQYERQYKWQYKGVRRFSVRKIVAGVVFLFLLGAGLGCWQTSQELPNWLAAEKAPVELSPFSEAGPGPVFSVRSTAALALLQRLPVRERASKSGYRREEFGEAWTDLDHNSCDTRNDILRRDLQDVEVTPHAACLVAAGRLSDPYTGQQLTFRRGPSSSSSVQIDHVVALSDAWQKGAQQLSPAQRLAFANDPLNLMAVDGPSNQEKSDADAAGWLPKNVAFRCEYVARQISVKAAYRLWLDAAEKAAMLSVLRSCPVQSTFASGFS